MTERRKERRKEKEKERRIGEKGKEGKGRGNERRRKSAYVCQVRRTLDFQTSMAQENNAVIKRNRKMR